ncbi:MAG TPA: succinate dehydrogenase/fumarate reductase iron-sulfur subunit, partial [Balneola sp.]|nr:succinate dehydrogenase/fumarate reductase iron-sulfur subunit [Balneola sp.]
MSKDMTIHLKYWKQAGPDVPGHFEEYTLDTVNEHMSFLEMLDVL